MKIMTEVIDYYHELLQAPGIAAATHATLQESQEQRGLLFGERHLCTVLRPHFYWAESWAFLKQQTEIILRAFAKAHHACMENADYRAQLGLEAFEEELFALDKGIKSPWTSSRLDAFFKSDDFTLKFVEYNAETPAGLGYGDELSQAFLELPVMEQFQRRYPIVESFQGQGALLSALLRGFQEWGGTGQPQIAIVDWAHVPTISEHRIARDFFESKGIRAILADPRELEYRKGRLYKGDFEITLIYKRVLISELLREMGMDNPIVQAVRDHSVMLTNSFSAKLMAKKASLAFLSDEQNADLFSVEEWKAINLHIPWTRRVTERKTFYSGLEIDLLDFAMQEQQRFVLKPNDEYGGAGVLLGWETSTETWQATLKQALESDIAYVLQERVEPVYRDYPCLIDGELDISPRFVDADPYVFNGETVVGCLTRLSSAALLNVTAGKGSVVPAFILQQPA